MKQLLTYGEVLSDQIKIGNMGFYVPNTIYINLKAFIKIIEKHMTIF